MKESVLRKQVHFLVCFFAAVVGGASMFPVGCAEKEPVRIGFVGGLSGRVADLGISGRNGAILAVEAIIGHMTSSMSKATVSVVNGTDTVLVSPTSTTTYFTGLDDNFLRVTPTTREYATKMARYLGATMGLKSVAVVYDLRNQAYTEGWYEDFSREFQALGGSVVQVETFHSGPDVHFYDIVERIFVPDAEGFVSIAAAMDTAMFSQQIRKLGRDIPVAAAEWASTETLVDLGGEAVKGKKLPS